METKPITVNSLEYDIFAEDTLSNISLSDKISINTINQYSYCIAEKDHLFKKALQGSEILLADGIGITIAVKLLNNKSIKKIAGFDVHSFLLQKLNKHGGGTFYLGSTEQTLDLIKTRSLKEFSNVKVDHYSPPYKDNFDEDDNDKIIETINAAKPDILFVGMTAPKQEKWVAENRDRLDVSIICCIGAAFDFYAGTINRPARFWSNIGLEWFIRLIKEPRRLGKRYLYYGPIFVFTILIKWLFPVNEAGTLEVNYNQL